MSDLSPSTLSSKLYIPPELLREIFSHCDTPTLGNVCKVNRACLELASPFLYTHIVLDSIDSVVKLFLLEDSHDSLSDVAVGRIEADRSLVDLPSNAQTTSSLPSPIASLPRLVPLSRIRTFTYFSKDTSGEECDLQLPSDLPQTLLPNPPLPIDVLIINIRTHQTIRDERRSATVLNLFNPSVFVLRSDRGGGELCLIFGSYASDADVSFYLPSWNRLTSVVLSNSTTCLPIAGLGLDQLSLAEEAEEGGGTNGASFLLCCDFLDPVDPSSEWFLDFAFEANTLRGSSEKIPHGTLFRLVAWVQTEEEKEELERETVRYVRDGRFVFGEQPGGKLEISVEVRPSRAGMRDREDAWAGKAAESWR